MAEAFPVNCKDLLPNVNIPVAQLAEQMIQLTNPHY